MEQGHQPKHRRMPYDEDLPIEEPAIDLDGFVTAPTERSTLSLGQLRPKDRSNFFFLSLLYFIQGVPVGLAFGSVPFLLKERISYAQIGVFSFCTYPFSLKLLWSPIVDGLFWPGVGRRRSWIIPVQLISSFLLIWLSYIIRPLLDDAEHNLLMITSFFFLLVFASATQDIAVDGWALTLLSQPALPYASTAQTIGINGGYFTSFTVFLALNSPHFANKYIRNLPSDEGLVSLEGYLFFIGIAYLVVTLFVALRKKEVTITYNRVESVWIEIRNIYRSMFGLLRLPSLQSLLLVHIFAKIAFQAADAVTNLKLLEKGLSKEDLALIVLIDYPFEAFFGYYTAKWATKGSPLNPWLWAYMGRIVHCLVSMSQVYFYPKTGTTKTYLLYVMIVHVTGSFLSTVQFVAICAFHTMIADPEIGGTYMTVLNTICNFGGTWPRFIVLVGVDWFTQATCSNGTPCVTESQRHECVKAGGFCTIERDGYYIVNILCVTLGVLMFYGFIKNILERLQHLPTKAWRLAED